MAHAQYAPPGPTTYDPPVINVVAGGGDLSAGSLYFCVQGRNRVGLNLHSTPQLVTWSAGDAIEITLDPRFRPDGCEVLYWLVSASDSVAKNTMTQIAQIEAVDGSGAETPLPLTITFDRDAHLQRLAEVATAALLPSGSDLMPGMLRGVQEWGFVYRYDANALSDRDAPDFIATTPGGWFPHGTFSTYFGDSTLEEGGCDRALGSIDDREVITPVYAAEGGDSPPVKFWLFYDRTVGGASAQAGKPMTANVSINGRAANQLLKVGDRVEFTFHGYASILDGTLDTLDLELASSQKSLAFREPAYRLEKALAGGMAVVFSVNINLNALDFQGEIADGDTIGVSPKWLAAGGEYVPGASILLGNIATPYGNGIARALPHPGAAIRTQPGRLYVFERATVVDWEVVYGLATDSAGQKLVVDSNGYWRVVGSSVPVSEPEIIRAVVSTESGESNPGAWSSVVACDGSLDITVSYPSVVRGDYPDLIALDADAELNATQCWVYVENTGLGEIRRFEFALLAGATQQFSISDWSLGTVVTALPVRPSDDFGFWEPGETTLVDGTVGTLAAGNYRACYAFHYDGNTATKIDHTPEPMDYLREQRDSLDGIAYLDAAQTFSKFQGIQPEIVADSDPVQFDLNASNRFEIFLDSAIAVRRIENPRNLRMGNFDIWLYQPSSPVFVTWGTKFRFPSGTSSAINTIADTVTVVSCSVGSTGLILCEISAYYSTT